MAQEAQCPSRLLLLAVPLLLLLAAVLVVLAVLAALPGLLALAGRPDIREAAGLWGWTGCGGAAVEGLRRRGEWLCVWLGAGRLARLEGVGSVSSRT